MASVALPHSHNKFSSVGGSTDHSSIIGWIEDLEISRSEKDSIISLEFDAGELWGFDRSLLYTMLRDLNVSVVSCKKIISNIEILETDDHIDFLSSVAATTDEQYYWFYAIILGLLSICLPTLLVWFPYRYGNLQVDSYNCWYTVIVPFLIMVIIVFGSTPFLSMHMATDTVQERSHGVDMKPLMESQFTNIGIVSALLLTILVAALQVDCPDPSSIIWVWYIIMLTLGLYLSFASTMTCAVMLVYITPLEGSAVENFISIMALYAGEPVTNLMYTVVTMMISLLLWIGGTYGDAPFITSLIIMTFAVTRTTVVMQNLQGYKNPQVTEAVRKKRTTVVSRKDMDGKVQQMPM